MRTQIYKLISRDIFTNSTAMDVLLDSFKFFLLNRFVHFFQMHISVNRILKVKKLGNISVYFTI